MISLPHGIRSRLALAATLVFGMHPSIAQTADPVAADAVMRKSSCYKCHSVEREKAGPPFKEVAQRYRGKADAEESLVRFLKTGARPGKDAHPQVKSTDDAEIGNLVRYVLSR